jgi:beta-glucanase (GH16 family)
VSVLMRILSRGLVMAAVSLSLLALTGDSASSRLRSAVSSTSSDGWTLVWADEFNVADGSAPDSTKWAFDLGGGGWGNKELESYTKRPGNVQIQGGNLVITARSEKYTGDDGIAREYTSARLKTQKLFAQPYGRFEARIKIPAGEGMWPAFWMLGEDIGAVGWPKCGEIDIMENIGKEPGAVHGSLHGPSSSAATTSQTSTVQLPEGQKFADDFHIYAVEWDLNGVKFFVDSTNYATMTKEQWPATGPWVFDHPFFIILNLAVGGDWPGPPDAKTQFPKQMLVDYVRVYKK